jgi:hypothetical protein
MMADPGFGARRGAATVDGPAFLALMALHTPLGPRGYASGASASAIFAA